MKVKLYVIYVIEGYLFQVHTYTWDIIYELFAHSLQFVCKI